MYTVKELIETLKHFPEVYEVKINHLSNFEIGTSYAIEAVGISHEEQTVHLFKY